MEVINESSYMLYCGNLSDRVTEDILYELFYQIGPLDFVKRVKDRTGALCNYAFIKYKHIESVQFAMEAFVDIYLYGQKLKVLEKSGANVESSRRQTDSSSSPRKTTISNRVHVPPPQTEYSSSHSMHTSHLKPCSSQAFHSDSSAPNNFSRYTAYPANGQYLPRDYNAVPNSVYPPVAMYTSSLDERMYDRNKRIQESHVEDQRRRIFDRKNMASQAREQRYYPYHDSYSNRHRR